jgi:arylsulfatase
MKRLLIAATALIAFGGIAFAQDAEKPNILVIWGDDIGTWNISHNNRGMMGYETPNIDRIANKGLSFTDYYAQQSFFFPGGAGGGSSSSSLSSSPA